MGLWRSHWCDREPVVEVMRLLLKPPILSIGINGNVSLTNGKFNKSYNVPSSSRAEACQSYLVINVLFLIYDVIDITISTTVTLLAAYLHGFLKPGLRTYDLFTHHVLRYSVLVGCLLALKTLLPYPAVNAYFASSDYALHSLSRVSSMAYY